jgi:hypothetical protein
MFSLFFQNFFWDVYVYKYVYKHWVRGFSIQKFLVFFPVHKKIKIFHFFFFAKINRLEWILCVFFKGGRNGVQKSLGYKSLGLGCCFRHTRPFGETHTSKHTHTINESWLWEVEKEKRGLIALDMKTCVREDIFLLAGSSF